ncbi:MAG: hypothetical protein M1274_13000 [Actinobacteria bacterium]|nr:hypothetical protein [Actinomycetota bacterium]
MGTLAEPCHSRARNNLVSPPATAVERTNSHRMIAVETSRALIVALGPVHSLSARMLTATKDVDCQSSGNRQVIPK